MMLETSIYLHIPFCRRRCGYCDFNTYAGFSHAIPAYVKALCKEVEYVVDQQKYSSSIQTVFFGGGTPSLLSTQQFSEIFAQLNKSFVIAEDAEITLEANPGTVSRNYLADLRQMGFHPHQFWNAISEPPGLEDSGSATPVRGCRQCRRMEPVGGVSAHQSGLDLRHSRAESGTLAGDIAVGLSI